MAVGIRVVLSMALSIYQTGQASEVHELVEDDEGNLHVQDAPEELRAGKVTVVDVDGSPFFAAARTLCGMATELAEKLERAGQLGLGDDVVLDPERRSEPLAAGGGAPGRGVGGAAGRGLGQPAGARGLLANLDQVLRTMPATGRDMHEKYRKTSLGGLAVNVTEC